MELSTEQFERLTKSQNLEIYTENDLFFKARKDLSGLVKVKVTDKKGNSVYRWVKQGEKPKQVLDSAFVALNTKYKLSRLPVGIPKEKVAINTDGSQGNWVLKWNDPKTNKIVQAYSAKFLEVVD